MTLSIDFDAIGGAPASVGAADTGVGQLARAAASGDVASGTLSALAMLGPAQAEQARAVARKQFPVLLADTQQLATFGDPALAAVNAQVNRIFREVAPVQIPELTTIMHQLNDRMRALRGRYDPNDPRIREVFDQFMDAVRGIFARGRDIVEMLFEEARSVEQHLDRVAGQLTTKQHELKRNVVLCDELYKANEASISQLVGVIAVMEAVTDEALAAQAAIVVDPADPAFREKQEERARITEFIAALQTRIGEFQQRLFVAWSTSPQIRNIRALHFGLGQRLALMVNLTIPTMKLTIAQWGLLMQDQAAQMQQAVADSANEVLSAYCVGLGSGRAEGRPPDADADADAEDDPRRRRVPGPPGHRHHRGRPLRRRGAQGGRRVDPGRAELDRGVVGEARRDGRRAGVALGAAGRAARRAFAAGRRARAGPRGPAGGAGGLSPPDPPRA